jgi:surface polysaccharide O-acyltransferase-like enzyme
MQLSSDQPSDQPAELRSAAIPPTAYIAYADIMRAVAILMVVWTHTASAYVYGLPLSPATAANWSAANLLMAFVRPAVPLFLMLSGALLLQPEKASEPLSQFFSKRFAKVLIPFLFWSVAFLGWRIWFRGEVISAQQAIQELLKGTVYPHLWFVYVILALYLATPVLRQYTHQARPANLAYGLWLWFCASVIMPMVRLVPGWDFQLTIFLPFTGYLGFYMAGYYLHQVQVPAALRRCLPAVYGLGALVTAGLTESLTRQAGGKIDDAFYGNLTPNIVIMAFCLFLWIKDLPCERWIAASRSFKNLIKLCGATSFSVYLIHPVLYEILSSGRLGFQLNTLPVSALLTIPVFTLLIWGISTALVRMIRLLPGGAVITT